jgi:hypothetical protein
MRHAGQTDRDLDCPDIKWLLLCAASALGSRGTAASVTNSLERGGGGCGIPNTDLYDDRQVGWCAGEGDVERHRRLSPIWEHLSPEAQAVLLAHYLPRNDIDPESRQALYAEVRTAGEHGVPLAGAALYINDPEQNARLLYACRTPTRKDANDKVDKSWPRARQQIIDAARSRAEEAVRQAHRLWHAVASLRPTKGPDRRIEFHGVETPEKRARWEAEYRMRLADGPKAAERLRRQSEELALQKATERTARLLTRLLGAPWRGPREKRAEGVQRAVAAE